MCHCQAFCWSGPCVTISSVITMMINQIAKTFGAILIKHQPDMKVSNWCLIEVDLRVFATWVSAQITKFMGPTWGPPGSCRPQVGPMLVPWTLLSGYVKHVLALLWSSTMTKQYAVFGCWAVHEKKVLIYVSPKPFTWVLKWDLILNCFHSKSIASILHSEQDTKSIYRKVSNLRCTKSLNLNASHLIL